MLLCNGHPLEKEWEGLVIMFDALLTPADICEQTESEWPRAPEVFCNWDKNGGIWTVEHVRVTCRSM